MINFVTKFWKEGVMFLVVSAIYVICTAPHPTWVSLDC
jgi:hypothetical protein